MTTSTPGFPVNGGNDEGPIRDALVGEAGDRADEGTIGAGPEGLDPAGGTGGTTDERSTDFADGGPGAFGSDDGVPVGAADADADAARTRD